MSGASRSTHVTSPPAACRQLRWRRSTWYHLLEAIEAFTASRHVSVDALLGRPPERVRAWRDAAEEMPLADQWRLTVIAQALLPHEPEIARYAHVLRGQLEAQAAYLARGPVRSNATLEEARAMQDQAKATRAAISEGPSLYNAPAVTADAKARDIGTTDRIVTDARRLFESSASVRPTIPKAV